MNNNSILPKKVQKIAQEFTQKMSIIAKVDVSIKEDIINISFSSPDSAILIGKYGETLLALQYILNIIIQKETDFSFKNRILVDIDDYKKNQDERLREYAREIAKKVVEYQRAEILKAMTSYERRIVHLELADDDKIVTESIGEGLERRIMIKPK